MIRRGLWALSLPFAGSAAAEGLSLQFPVDCTLGDSCYIQQYMDRDPGDASRDYQCLDLSYDGHKGTDFALPNRAGMRAGVDVLAAADGQVRGRRNQMPDIGYTDETAASVKGKECGNGVVLAHPGGWETQYCHLKQGSVSVEKGQMVKAGDVLGQIGLSGRTEFPHLHLSVRKDGKPVDPFDPDGTLTCASPGDSTLWAETPTYQPGGILEVGLRTAMPKYEAVKDGLAPVRTLPVTAPALFIYSFSFGTRKDDVIRLEVSGPQGVVIAEDRTLTRRNAQTFRAVGQHLRRRETWPAGPYVARATLLRGGIVINSRQEHVIIK